MCPSQDWRNPPTIDSYNQITKKICKELNVRLIDTSFIMSIMWDRAEDWCHYKDESTTMESLYVLDRILT